MKKDIHPEFNSEAQVICACGNTFKTGSTMSEIKTELCSKCHPFFTGKQKLIDSARRVEKFKAKVSASKELSEVKKGRTAKRAGKAALKSEKKETIKKTEKK